MYFIGNVITDPSKNMYLRTDVSGDALIVIDDIPNSPSFITGFNYDISGIGLLRVYIGDIENHLQFDLSSNMLYVSVNDISCAQISIDMSFNTFVPIDIKLLNKKLTVNFNDARYLNKLDVSLNEFKNNKMIIVGKTTSTNLHIVRDVFYEPIVMFNDDIYIARGVYAERYFNVDYNDVENKPWSNNNDIAYRYGNVGIGTNDPRAVLDVSGNVIAYKFIGDLSGNATTVTSGIYTTSSYSNPYWITDLSGAKITGDISGNARNVTGAVGVANGGTGQTTLTANKVLIGNGTSGVLQPTNLHWDNTNNRLSIGSSSPSQALDVSGNIVVRGNISPTTTQAFDLGSSINYWRNIYLSDNINFSYGGGWYMDNYSYIKASNRPIYVNTPGSVISQLQVTTTTSPSGSWIFQGDNNLVNYYNGSVLWSAGTSVSDRQFKENIRPISDSLEKVKRMNAYYFTYKQGVTPYGCGKEQVGVMADEIQNIVPSSVNTFEKRDASNNYTGGTSHTVHLEKIVPFLIESVKVLSQENDLLKERLARIEALLSI